jgi:hypothetical protein
MDSFIDVIDLKTMTSMSPPEQIPTQGAWDPAYAPAVGVLVFAAASLLKDTVNRLGDLLDDGQPNSSFNS